MSTTDKQFRASVGCICCGGTVAAPWLRVPSRMESEPEYVLLCCSSCSHIWLTDPPNPKRLSYYYEAAYHQAIGRSGDHDPERWGRQLAVISQYKTTGSVLDIGCSTGGFLAYLKGGPWTLSGIEANAATAERARLATGGNIFAGNVEDAEFAPDTFDVITCSDVLEHLYDPRMVFQLVSKWLKPGGIFYVFVPNIMSWEARAFGTFWFGLDLPRHLQHYSAASLRTLSHSAGLRQMRMLTPAGCYAMQSTSLWVNEMLRKAGATNPSVNLNGPGWIGWRALRKVLRLTVEAGFAHFASACGASASLQAVFQKPPIAVKSSSDGIGLKSEAMGSSAPAREEQVVAQ